MEVQKAIEALQTAGEVTIEHETIRTRIPRSRNRELQTALQTVRDHKAEALVVLRQEENLQAARAFVNKAGARLVCEYCWPECLPDIGYTILVPQENADADFWEALRVLQLDHVPVLPRTDPLDRIPRCSSRRGR